MVNIHFPTFHNCKEGILGQWKKRWCVIEGGNFKIYMNQNVCFESCITYKKDAQPFKVWNLQEYELTLAPTLKKYSFHLGKSKTHHYVRCQTQNEADDWMNFIGKFSRDVNLTDPDAPLVVPKPNKPMPSVCIVK